MGLAGRDDIVVALVLLQHQPHGLDIFGRVAPVAFGFEVAEDRVLLQPGLDAGQRARDFAGDKRFAAAGRFVVERMPLLACMP